MNGHILILITKCYVIVVMKCKRVDFNKDSCVFFIYKYDFSKEVCCFLKNILLFDKYNNDTAEP